MTMTKNGRCFVIQPFDGDLFDRRYADVFGPAIVDAGLTPYRVDQDPGVVVPIETIEQEIAEADACFAEITLDNPNVWFEVGFARALRKPLCMVCSSERKLPFPFDVRHRAIIKYNSGAPSDFNKLRTDITIAHSAGVWVTLIMRPSNLAIRHEPAGRGAGAHQNATGRNNEKRVCCTRAVSDCQ